METVDWLVGNRQCIYLDNWRFFLWSVFIKAHLF
jgi:hypothetical protein